MSSLSRGKIETLVDGRDPSTGDGAYRLNFILPFLNTYDLNLTFGYTFHDPYILFFPNSSRIFSFLRRYFPRFSNLQNIWKRISEYSFSSSSSSSCFSFKRSNFSFDIFFLRIVRRFLNSQTILNRDSRKD